MSAKGLLLAFAGGLAIDLITGLPLGTTPLALMPVCFLGVIGRSSIYVNNLWLPVLLVAIATPLDGWLMLLIRQLRGLPVDWQGATTAGHPACVGAERDPHHDRRTPAAALRSRARVEAMA